MDWKANVCAHLNSGWGQDCKEFPNDISLKIEKYDSWTEWPILKKFKKYTFIIAITII